MNPMRILGLVILAAGIAILVMGMNASNSMGDQITHGVTGHYTDHTTWYIIGGIVGIVAGGALALFGRGAKA